MLPPPHAGNLFGEGKMTAWGMTSWGFLGWMCILGGDSPLLPKTQPRAVPCRPSEWNRCQFPPPPPR